MPTLIRRKTAKRILLGLRRAAAVVGLFFVIALWPAAIIGVQEAAAATDNVAPALSVPIPTLPEFSKITVSGPKGNQNLNIPWIAQYVAAIYKYGVGVAGMLASVMIMIGGVQYLTAGGDASRVSAAKQRINDAIIGLALSVGAYVILNTINPQILNLQALQIQYIEPEPLQFTGDAETNSAYAVATDFKRPQRPNISGSGGGLNAIPADLTPLLEQAADDLATQGYGIYVGSGFRDPKVQIGLILQNCQNPPGAATCKPFAGKPYTCIMAGANGVADPRSCPHTTGHALDLWGMKCVNGVCDRCVGGKYSNLTFEDCNSGKMQQCVDDPCQQALIKAMGKVGFCRWTGEAWHFEKPAMSKNCVVGQ